MKADFDEIRGTMKTGFWQITRNLLTDDAELELDREARKMLGADAVWDPLQTYEYWREQLGAAGRETLDNFFKSLSIEDEMIESAYQWKLPGEGERYIRMCGTLAAKSSKKAVYTGMFTDISSAKNLNMIIEHNGTDKAMYDLEREKSAVLEALGSIVEFRNMESMSHIRCVKEFTSILADYVAEHYPEYGITHRIAGAISDASPLHDVGKIAISDMILLKPGRLTRAEFDMMKNHSRMGYDIIQTLTMLDENYRRFAGEIALSHHERYDGRGYPNGLKGDRIPIAAQIVSLVDVYDALITPRIYNAAYTSKQAYNMIMNGECGAFNPKLLSAFEVVIGKFEKVAAKFKNKESDNI